MGTRQKIIVNPTRNAAGELRTVFDELGRRINEVVDGTELNWTAELQRAVTRGDLIVVTRSQPKPKNEMPDAADRKK